MLTPVDPEALVYQSDLDEQRRAGLAPYAVEDVPVPWVEIRADIDRRMLELSDARSRSGEGPLGDVGEFERLLAQLADVPGLSFARHKTWAQQPGPTGGRVCYFRHDIDVDLATAVRLAQVEARYGVPATYFVLHTAAYYSRMTAQKTLRFPAVLEPLRAIQELDHEIGLHVDALTLYQCYGIDGAAAVHTELAWLRDHGIDVVGSAAHNNYLFHGAENYAIFAGRRVHPLAPNGPMGVLHGDRWSPLQQLDEAGEGLIYEASDLAFQDDTNVFFASISGRDRWACRYRWAGMPRTAEVYGRPLEQLTQDQLLDRVRSLEGDCMLLFAVHPMYYGERRTARP